MLTALALLVIGAVVVLIGASQPWTPIGGWKTAGFPLSPNVMSGYPDDRRAVTGIGLVLLAAVVASMATRGLARRVVGGLVTAAALVLCLSAFRHVTVGPWPLLTAAGAVVAAAAGVLVVRHGRSWPSMSTRYEREAGAATRPATAWEAIDRGEDPTE